MEQDRVNEISSGKKISQKNVDNLLESLKEQKEQIKQLDNITYQDVERMLDLQSEVYKAQMSRDSSINDIVEKALVAAAGITGGAALLSSILGPTAATIAALVVAVTYIFLNVKKTLPKPEEESDPTGDTNA